MLEEVKAYMQKHCMLKKGDKVIAGVSGGADSICLLFVLAALREELGIKLHAVHVHHGLRGAEADRDELYAKEMCEKYSVPFVSCHYQVARIAKERKLSEEEAGRIVRREAFERVLEETGGSRIALAHHRDDNAETLLLCLARGTKLRGLGGIRPVQGKYIRPLLGVSRKEIEEFLCLQNISYCMDSTNQDDTYTRNRIRNYVIPFLENNVNSSAVIHMNAVMEQMRELNDYMEGQTEIWYQKAITENETGLLLRREVIADIPKVLRSMVIYQALSRITGSEKNLEQIHVDLMEGLFAHQTGKRLSLPKGILAVRTYEGVLLQRKYQNVPNQYHINIEETHINIDEINTTDGICELKPGITYTFAGWNVSSRIIIRGSSPMPELPRNGYTKWFDYDIIKNTVMLRHRQSGDYLTIDEKGRTQKLKSFLINEKVPADQRNRLLLVAEGQHILWVAGLRMGHYARVTPDTRRVLEIHINEGEKYVRDNQSITFRGRGCKKDQ